MVSNPVLGAVAGESQRDNERGKSRWRWLFSLLVLICIGWAWPYNPASVPDRLGDTSWMLGWLTIVVLIGASSGYVLQSRWSVGVTSLGLYIGGVLHWLYFDWGFYWPDWEGFLPFSAAALGILLLTAGLSAGIASRVVPPETRSIRNGSECINLSAALAPLLGLIALTTINVLPFPYIGGLLGVAAVLSGIAVIQEDRTSAREHLLAVAGMMFGVAAAGTQIYSFWALVANA